MTGPERQVLNVEDRLVEQLSDMRVVQAIDDLLATPLADHEPEVAKRAQLVRDRRGLHPHRLSELADRARALLEAPEDLYATRAGEHLHPLGDGSRKHGVDHRRDCLTVDPVAHLNA